MRNLIGLALLGIVLVGCSDAQTLEEASAARQTELDVADETPSPIEEESSSAEMALQDIANGESFDFAFALPDIAGNNQSLVAYQGKVVIVDIWGTWCPPCRAEIPSFIKLQENFGEQGLQILGLNYEGGSPDVDTAKVNAYVAETGINYPCILGDDATLEQVPDFEGYPTTVFLDKTGKVRLKAVGLHDYEYLEAIVSKLLAE